MHAVLKVVLPMIAASALLTGCVATAKPFGKDTWAVGMDTIPADGYLTVANKKCDSLDHQTMQPVHAGGDGLFVFRCTNNPQETHWHSDGGDMTVHVKQ